jgi:predicted Rossmann fold nucleotide-binding protein DprA/Smf involved in DNA uptake
MKTIEEVNAERWARSLCEEMAQAIVDGTARVFRAKAHDRIVNGPGGTCVVVKHGRLWVF